MSHPKTNADRAAAPEAAAKAAQGEEPGGADRGIEDGPAARRKRRPAKVPEFGGPEGPEPTRYGDWERNGRCIDF